MEIPAFFDLSPQFAGWCIGSGETTPTAGAHKFDDHGDDDLGALGAELWSVLDLLHQRFGFTTVGYEKPILVVNARGKDGARRTDKLVDLRRIYGLGMVIETWCALHDIPCGEETVQAVKKAATGNQHAEKKDVADAMERLGIVLPATRGAGRWDAGDAAAGWLLSVRAWNPWLAERFDKLLFRKGALLV